MERNEKKSQPKKEKACACDDKKKQRAREEGRGARKEAEKMEGGTKEDRAVNRQQVDGRAERKKTARGNLGSVFMWWGSLCTVTCGRLVGTWHAAPAITF